MALRTAGKAAVVIVAGCGAAILIAIGCGDSSDNAAGTSGSGTGQGGMVNIGGGAGSAGNGGTVNLDGANGDGNGGTGGKPPVGCGNVVTGTVRDFHAGLDFQCTNSGYTDTTGKECGPWDPAIVGALGSAIGPNRKPAFAGGSKTASTTSGTNFDTWYNDAPGVNLADALDIKMVAGTSGTFVYETSFFFPIDNKLFAAQGGDPDKGPYKSDDQAVRNFHFTYELHTTFRYKTGNVFTFRGDDDVFVYINDKLAVNLGGIHVPLQGKINLDTGRVEITVDAQPGWSELVKLHTAPELGFTEEIQGGIAGTVALNLTPGEVYNMDFFFAERNCCASNFRMETDFEFVDCGTGPIK
jgi:fibro-slime domain-containing protein